MLNHRRILGLRHLLLLIKQFEDALRRGHRRLNDVREVRKLGDRLRELLCVLDKSRHIANSNGSLSHQNAADYRDKHVADVADKAHERHNDARNELRSPASFVELLIAHGKFGNGLCLAPEGFDDLVTHIHLLDMAVEFSKRPLLPSEVILRAFGNTHCDEQTQWKGQQYNQAEERTDRQHQHDHTDQRHKRGNQLRDTLLERGAEIIHIVDRAAHNFAVRARVEVLQRQA